MAMSRPHSSHPTRTQISTGLVVSPKIVTRTWLCSLAIGPVLALVYGVPEVIPLFAVANLTLGLILWGTSHWGAGWPREVQLEGDRLWISDREDEIEVSLTHLWRIDEQRTRNGGRLIYLTFDIDTRFGKQVVFHPFLQWRDLLPWGSHPIVDFLEVQAAEAKARAKARRDSRSLGTTTPSRPPISPPRASP